MDNRFFEKPVINSPYEYPTHHWELDEEGQRTQRIVENRRSAKFITPIPKPKKRKKAVQIQQDLVFDEGTFAEFTEVYEIEADFQKKLDSNFDNMIDRFASGRG